MKKIIILLLSVYFFYIFLVYAGFFRDNSKPLDVAKYYFDCMKNREWFLTYQVCKPEAFRLDYGWQIYDKFQMGLVNKIRLSLLSNDNKNALVQASFFYKDSHHIDAIAKLEKMDKMWKIQKSGLD